MGRLNTAGVLSANVSVGTEEAVVEYLPSIADLGAIKGAVASAGYKVVEAPVLSSQTEADKETKEREREDIDKPQLQYQVSNAARDGKMELMK